MKFTTLLATLVLLSPGLALAELRIYHIDVEQADATLIVSPTGETLLVDGGKNGHGQRVQDAMAELGVTQIDHLVVTYYHEDYYGGVDELVEPPGAVEVISAHDRGDKAFLGDKLTQTVGIAKLTAGNRDRK